jgi:hypothetical protein
MQPTFLHTGDKRARQMGNWEGTIGDRTLIEILANSTAQSFNLKQLCMGYKEKVHICSQHFCTQVTRGPPDKWQLGGTIGDRSLIEIPGK